jgi:hypothetical protein
VIRHTQRDSSYSNCNQADRLAITANIIRKRSTLSIFAAVSFRTCKHCFWKYNNSAVGRGAPAVAVIHMSALPKKRKLSHGRSRPSLENVASASSFSGHQAAQVQS